MRHKNFFRYFTTILCLVLLCTLGAVVWKFGAKPQNDNEETYSKLECCIVSVGDGSCAVLKCGDKSVMIDIGPSDAKTHVKEVLEQMQIYEVDCLLISHPHSDHYGGFKALKDISVKELYISPQTSDKSFYADCLEFFTKKGISPQVAPIGETIEIGELKISFLGPLRQNENINDMSVVAKVTYKDISILFPADMSGDETEQILESGCELSSNVFICAHHGSNADGANSYVLLREIMPDYVIISNAGSQSMYGYPHEEVLSRLNDLGCEVYRTDLYGDISFYTDGKKIYFN